MQYNPNDEIKMSPETKAVFEDAFIAQELDTWSIGKLKAYLEARGYNASKLKRPQLFYQVSRHMAQERQAQLWKPQDPVINDLNKAVDTYQKNNGRFA